MIDFEKEAIDFLSLPSIPKKEWDKKSSFSKGVAVINLLCGKKAYAICSFDNEKEKKPKVLKVFSIEPFTGIDTIYIVPEYMQDSSDVVFMDLDDNSKKKVEILLNEAEELENDGVIERDFAEPDNEYYFDNISNDEEAIAFIKFYNKKNKIRGGIPKTHDGIIMRLSVLYNDMKNGKEKTN